MEKFDLEIRAGFHPEIASLIATWEDGTREWLESLGEPSEEALVWQPYANGPSIGGEMLHMIECDMFWVEEVLGGLAERNDHPAVKYGKGLDQENHIWPTAYSENWAWYLDLYLTSRKSVLDQLSNLTDITKVYPFKGGEFTARWIVAHIVEHDSYHGGQAVLLHEMWKKLGR